MSVFVFLGHIRLGGTIGDRARKFWHFRLVAEFIYSSGGGFRLFAAFIYSSHPDLQNLKVPRPSKFEGRVHLQLGARNLSILAKTFRSLVTHWLGTLGDLIQGSLADA